MRVEDLEEKVTGGDVLGTPETPVLVPYVEVATGLSDTFYLFRIDKSGGNWSTAMLQWPASSGDDCPGGSILKIAESKNHIYPEAHITPPASCAMIINRKDLKFHDACPGWITTQIANGTLVYERGEIHFAPSHYVERMPIPLCARMHPERFQIPLRRI